MDGTRENVKTKHALATRTFYASATVQRGKPGPQPDSPQRNRHASLTGQALRNSSCDGHLEHFMLISFHHEQDPKDKRKEADGAVQRPSYAECSESAPHQQARAEENSDDNVQDVQSPQHYTRLRRVKAHKWTLIDQEHDDSR